MAPGDYGLVARRMATNWELTPYATSSCSIGVVFDCRSRRPADLGDRKDQRTRWRIRSPAKEDPLAGRRTERVAPGPAKHPGHIGLQDCGEISRARSNSPPCFSGG